MATETWANLSREKYVDETLSDSVMGAEKRRRQSVAFDLIDWSAVDSLCEVGVGSGTFLHRADAEHGADLSAVDVNHKLLSAVSDVASAYVGDIRNLPVPDNSFDATVCLAVVGHLEPGFSDPAIRELLRVTNPGGQVVVSVGNKHGLARRVRDRWQKTRIRFKNLTGLGADEDWFASHDVNGVAEALQSAGVVERRDITLMPGLSAAEVPVESALHRSLSDKSRLRPLLSQTAILKADLNTKSV